MGDAARSRFPAGMTDRKGNAKGKNRVGFCDIPPALVFGEEKSPVWVAARQLRDRDLVNPNKRN
jgi:hypothetical protein